MLLVGAFVRLLLAIALTLCAEVMDGVSVAVMVTGAEHIEVDTAGGADMIGLANVDDAVVAITGVIEVLLLIVLVIVAAVVEELETLIKSDAEFVMIGVIFAAKFETNDSLEEVGIVLLQLENVVTVGVEVGDGIERLVD